jgi:hypothetical protein
MPKAWSKHTLKPLQRQCAVPTERSTVDSSFALDPEYGAA